MSSSRRFIAPSVGLLLAAGYAPAGAQQRVEGGAARRVQVVDSTERQVRLVERQLDSLTRIYSEQDDLSAADRQALARKINALVALFRDAANRLNAEGHSEFRVRVMPRGGVASMSVSRGMAELQTAQVQSKPMGWLGFVAFGPSLQTRNEDGEQIVRFASYPRIMSVEPGSPALAAGILPGDTLIAYDGRDVRENDISMTKLLRPHAKVMVRLRREGRVREVPLIVAAAPQRIVIRRDDEARDTREMWIVAGVPEAPGFPRAGNVSSMAPPNALGAMSVMTRAPIPPSAPPAGTYMRGNLLPSLANGVAGAQVATVGPGFAKSLGVEYGVVVSSVPPGSQAGDAGLTDSDVIVRAANVPIRDVYGLREVIQRVVDNGEHAIDLEIVRDHKAQKITLKW